MHVRHLFTGTCSRFCSNEHTRQYMQIGRALTSWLTVSIETKMVFARKENLRTEFLARFDNNTKRVICSRGFLSIITAAVAISDRWVLFIGCLLFLIPVFVSRDALKAHLILIGIKSARLACAAAASVI